MKSLRVLPLAVAIALLAPFARADASSSAAAESLFEEGKKLAAQKNYDAACPKFAESQRLDPGAGTQLHLADCYEKQGKTASAWATYIDAAAAAKAQNKSDWEKLARTRAAALEGKLSKLTVRADKMAQGEQITRDGALVEGGSLGAAIPVDPGTHAIEAHADGKKPYSSSIDVGPNGDTKEVVVPALEDAPQATVVPPTPPQQPPPQQPPPDKHEGSSQRTIGYVVAIVGVAGVGVGAVTGFMAIGKNNDSKNLCPNVGACASSAGVDDNSSAKSLGTVSTIGFIAGGVALGVGAALILTAPKGAEKAGAIRVVPAVGAREQGLLVTGSW